MTVTITNVGAGHYLPTGLTEVRQMWLQVVAVDENGKETELGKRVFGTELKDKNGKYPVELWDAVGGRHATTASRRWNRSARPTSWRSRQGWRLRT